MAIRDKVKWGTNTFNISLQSDKGLNPFTFTYPAIWSGSISNGEFGEVQIKQTARERFEKIEYPEFAGVVYHEVCKLISQECKSMD